MPELQKRLNMGWVLDSYSKTSDNHEHYYLARGKCSCEIELGPDGRGWLITSSSTKRI